MITPRRRRLAFPSILGLLATASVAAAAAQSASDVAQQPAPAARAPAVAPPLQFPLEPAGTVVPAREPRLAEGSLPVALVRSPDTTGPGGGGRYLVAVNSGYGVQFAAKQEQSQLLQVIDLNAEPEPTIVQAVYFPAPQSVNIGLAFGRRPARGAWPLYASGGVQDRVWQFTFTIGAGQPIAPANDVPGREIAAPFIDLSSGARTARPAAGRKAPGLLYPSGLAVSADGRTLFVANNLADSLMAVRVGRGRARVESLSLVDPQHPTGMVYPYGVIAAGRGRGEKVYVSCWNEASVAVIDPRRLRVRSRIAVGSHPSALAVSRDGRLLFVASANSDTVSVIDTATDRERARIPVGLRGPDVLGNSPQALALTDDGRALLVANAQSSSVAVVRLGEDVLENEPEERTPTDGESEGDDRSRVIGYIPTARYPSALAVVGRDVYVANGKGEPGPRPNAPTAAFPANHVLRGAYSVALVTSSIRRVALPEPAALAGMTSAVMRGNGLLGAPVDRLFPGPSPITHVIYVIKENRTYDQVLGDLPAAGDGTPADGDPALALFGNGEAARRPGGAPQAISPNHHALALRFGLFDRFFVNAEASADGHNWSTAAYSSDYVDKAFRASYSDRGRTYDYEGFNRLPDYEPPSELPAVLRLPLTAEDVVAYMRRFVPYLNGRRDAAEPDSLYLWDAAARAGVSYRSYGEFVGTMSAEDIAALNERRRKTYPDISPTVGTVPTKRALADHHSPTFRAFDLWTPDAMTTESYRAARTGSIDPMISTRHPDPRFRGTSRLGAWLDEFAGFVADLEAGRGDPLPALTIMRFPSDHTIGLTEGHATPQFMMADNDYAVGRLVEAVSRSPYWRSTAIFILEDDAQDGPDHLDAHRSPVLVISAWNRRGQLVHAMHNTVSFVRTIELLLGIPPMNQLDAAAVPFDIFGTEPDLTPYTALLPVVADDNLIFRKARNAREQYYVEQTARQNLAYPDMADPRTLNEVIWFSVRGAQSPMPQPVRWAAAEAAQSGLDDAAEDASRSPLYRARLALEHALDRARRHR